ncbi:MAG: efflux transporter outer membrane subunit [Verrucomicrobiota bacterium]|jgi:multidrug efflux system outer membrane protein
MKKLVLLSATIAAAALAGCAVGPDYHRPDALSSQPLPKTFSDNNPTNATIWKIAEPSADRPRGNWWELFDDAELSRLETIALTNNQNLIAAAANFEQARDLAQAARADFYPQLQAGGTPGGDITRQRNSVNEPETGLPAGISRTYNSFTAPVYLGWEMDLWGRVRRQSEAAKAQFIASRDDYESARLAVASEVADDYFNVRILDAQNALITNSIDAYERSLELTENLRRGGAVSDLDVAQAATQLHTAQAQLPDIELRRSQTLHALAILCGRSPVDFDVSTNFAIPSVPGIPPSLPSELLEHRPDVAAAERLMAAANAQVGVAKAAFFPTVRIDGLAGFQSISASSWFNWSSRMWSVGPSIELPLFTGGFNRANLAASHAAYDATVANYRSTVLGAFGEVEDELAAQRLLGDEWHAENESVISAQQALQIANNRYKAGLVTYLDVVTEQTQTLSIEQTAVQLEGARLTTTVNLIKALGAGWTPAQD